MERRDLSVKSYLNVSEVRSKVNIIGYFLARRSTWLITLIEKEALRSKSPPDGEPDILSTDTGLECFPDIGQF